MTILDKMEADARAVIERWDTPAWKDVEPTGHVINRLRETLREYESLKGQIAVVPVQTSEARKAALDWKGLKAILRTARARNESVSLELTNWIADNEAALQQPDTSEAVRVLVDALEHTKSFIEMMPKGIGRGAAGPLYQNVTTALDHPAVIAAMKGGGSY